MRAIARIEYLQQVDDAITLSRDPIPEDLVTCGPKDPGIATLDLIYGEPKTAVHRFEKVIFHFGKVGSRVSRDHRVIGRALQGTMAPRQKADRQSKESDRDNHAPI